MNVTREGKSVGSFKGVLPAVAFWVVLNKVAFWDSEIGVSTLLFNIIRRGWKTEVNWRSEAMTRWSNRTEWVV